MSTANSPTYAQGRADGLADTDRVRIGNGPDGPQPPFPDYPSDVHEGLRGDLQPRATR